MRMPTFHELRVQAGLSINRLSRLSDVDFRTAKRADTGEQIQELKARSLLATISTAIGRQITLAEVDDLKLYS